MSTTVSSQRRGTGRNADTTAQPQPQPPPQAQPPPQPAEPQQQQPQQQQPQQPQQQSPQQLATHDVLGVIAAAMQQQAVHTAAVREQTAIMHEQAVADREQRKTDKAGELATRITATFTAPRGRGKHAMFDPRAPRNGVPDTASIRAILAWFAALQSVQGIKTASPGLLRDALCFAFDSCTGARELFDSLDDDAFVMRDGVVPAIVTFLVERGFVRPGPEHAPAPTSTSVTDYVSVLRTFEQLTFEGMSAGAKARKVHEHLANPAKDSHEAMKLFEVQSSDELNDWLREHKLSARLATATGHQQPHNSNANRGKKSKKGKADKTKDGAPVSTASTSNTARADENESSSEYARLAGVRARAHGTTIPSRCQLDVAVLCNDRTPVTASAEIDAGADVNAVSKAFVTRHSLTTRQHRRKLRGASTSMRQESANAADLVVGVDGIELELNDAAVVDDLHCDIVIGLPAIAQYGIVTRHTVDGNFTFTIERSPADAAADSVLAALSSSAFKFVSPVDEVLANINKAELAVRIKDIDRFLLDVRSELDRLHARGLLLGKNSPGAKYPQALRGAVHKIVPKAGANLSQAYAKYRHMPFHKFKAVCQHFDELMDHGITVEADGPSPTQNVCLVVNKHDEHGNVTGQRVVIDARDLNRVTEYYKAELPLIAEMLRLASTGVLTSKVDLKDFYLQFPLDAETRHLLRTRVSDSKCVDWARMVPGLHSAPKTAQDFVDATFRQADQRAYLDDIIKAHTDVTADALLAWLRTLVDTCIARNVTVNAAKSFLFARSNVVLGHRVSHNRIEPLVERLQVLTDMAAPTTRAELQRFLAMARWYCHHIPNFSQLTAPLTDLMSPRTPFRWASLAREAFDNVKRALLNYATLSAPLPNVPVVVSTDASGAAVGYVVEQVDAAGNRRILALGGRKMNVHERNYTIHEKELLALRHVVQQLGEWLVAVAGGHPITWRTDSQTAAAFGSMSLGKSPAMAKFASELQHLPFIVELVKSVDNPVADAVSRQRLLVADDTTALAMMHADDDDDDSTDEPTDSTGSALDAQSTPSLSSATSTPTPPPPPPTRSTPRGESANPIVPPTIAVSSELPNTDTMTDLASSTTATPATETVATKHIETATTATPSPLVDDFIAQNKPEESHVARLVDAQARDPALDVLRDAIAHKHVPPEIHALKPCIDDQGVILVRRHGDSSQTVIAVPAELQVEFAHAAHAGHDGGHAGTKSSLWQSQQVGYWPTQANDVMNLARGCLTCQSTRHIRANADMGRPPTALKRFERIHIDAAHMPHVDGHVGFYTITDAATGYSWAHVVNDLSADSALQALTWYISTFDTPRCVQVDHGSELLSDKMRSMAEKEGFELRAGSPYNHQSSGIVESAIYRIKKALMHNVQRAGGNEKLWPSLLPHAMRSVNRVKSEPRGTSPCELMFGKLARLAIAARYGLDTDGSANAPIPADTDGQLAHAAKLAERIDTLLNAANAGRARRQAANADQQRRRGSARVVNEGDFVFIANNGQTQDSKFANKQTHSGPFEVLSIDHTNRRATLLRAADKKQLKTPVSLNRLQVVDKERVLNPSAPVFEPGAASWAGASDAQLLLPSERVSVNKSLAKQARDAEDAAARRRAAANEAQRLVDRQQALAAAADERQRREREQRAAARRASTAQKIAYATAEVPDDATPIGRLHHVNGTMITLTSPSTPAARIFISREHPRFNEFDATFNRQVQRARVDRRLRAGVAGNRRRS